MTRVLGRWTRLESLVPKVVRFSMIGLLSGGVFAAATALMTGWGGIDPKLSSGIGYIASIPVNFVGNWRFTFRSRNWWVGDLLRYTVLHGGNILLTMGAMAAAVQMLRLHYVVGIAAAVVFVPIVNFVIMNWWVFGKSARPATSGGTTPNSPIES